MARGARVPTDYRPRVRVPDYAGGSLLNLVAELERRLTGDAPHPGLYAHLTDTIPPAATYVMVLFDGLGDLQLGHAAAAPLLADRVGALDAPFPTTTTVSLATVATGLSPAEHGLLGYQLWLPEAELVVNTIKWITLWGQPIAWNHDSFLPAPNLWERLGAAGKEPITLQPFNFEGTPLSRTLYRGSRFEPWADEHEAVAAAAQLAAEPGRLIFLYVPHVDFAAHVAGQSDPAYEDALRIASGIWEQLGYALPAGAAAVGTADHGHLDVSAPDQFHLTKPDHEDRQFAGDARALFLHGDPGDLADRLPATWFPRSDMQHWWGPGRRHPAFDSRAPDGVFLADAGRSVLHRHADERLIGQHGGLDEAEVRIPLLVRRPAA